MVDQWGEPIRIFVRIDRPVRERARVVIAQPKPAVIQHEALRAQFGGAVGDVLQDRHLVVEIDVSQPL